MLTLTDFAPIPARWRGAHLAIGNFDGVHLGHARLLAQLRARADAAGTPALALTFDPHPVVLLRPEAAPTPLNWTERNLTLLRASGVDEVGVFRTGPWLLGLTAREFFDRVIVGQFAARGLVEGPDFHFGRDRQGDITRLAEWCSGAGLDFQVAEAVEVEGGVVSSSRIRACLADGRAGEAARLLGRPHRIRGEVVRGAGRGAGLGFPTANLAGIDTLIPADGVYAARAWIDGEGPPWPAACHIGPNATFGEQTRQVEVHLIGFTGGELYQRRVELELLERLRPTRRFDALPALLDQIRADVEQARAIAV